MRREFARLRAAHPFVSPYTLGQQVFKGKRDGVNRSAAAVTLWQDDPELLTETRNATGNDVVLPATKEDMARMYAGLVSRTKDAAVELKALDSMAEVLGFKGKPGAPAGPSIGTINNIDNRKVEYVAVAAPFKSHAESEAWLMEQQRQLIEAAG